MCRFMKRLVFLLVLSVCLANCAEARADAPHAYTLDQTASGRSRDCVVELSEGWKFGEADEAAAAEDFNDRAWTTVNVPHTWNSADGSDGGGNYKRTAYWYRKTLELDSSQEGRRVYLEFLGANQKTDLYVNGEHIRLCGSKDFTHKGGYTAFRYEITDALRPGTNTIAIRVDNRHDETIAPISADFNMYGGIYRRLFLVSVNEVHVDLSDCGSSGLFLTTPNVRSRERPADLGTLNIRANIVNQSQQSKAVTVVAEITGDNAPEPIVRRLEIAAGGSAMFCEDAFIEDPHLWYGVDYSGGGQAEEPGYRYTVSLKVYDGDELLDTVSDKVGFRYFYVDKESGFYLNGELHPLRGVNRHQFMEKKGSALLEPEHDDDFRMIMELGANSIRLCHYPQTDYFYDLCDENGIVVWTEIPFVNELGKEESFLDVTKAQLTELIRQQYNRPSICFWGLENEVREHGRSPYYSAKQAIAALDVLAHEEDSSGRYTTQAVNTDLAMDHGESGIYDDFAIEYGWSSELVAWNIYPGWYNSFVGTFEELTNSKIALESRPMGLSEYGWGASIQQHELYPVLGKNDLLPTGKWHPEEYQNLMHEQALAYINQHDELWGTYVWCMFDFDVDQRNEGSRVGQNDKGLVTNDRKTRKDSFYLYKANWDKREPLVHITSSRYENRKSASTYVKVYSNCDSVTLYCNGKELGSMPYKGDCVFLMEDVPLEIGENRLYVYGSRDGQGCEDTCQWTRNALSSAGLTSEVLEIDAKNKTVRIDSVLTLGELRENLLCTDNASYRVLNGGVEVSDENALVTAGMSLALTAENGKSQGSYAIIPPNLFTGKEIVASSTEDGRLAQSAVDNDKNSRWAAKNASYPQSITVDLGEEYFLGRLSIDWNAKNNRYYGYVVEASQDGVLFTEVSNRRDNRQSGTTTDELKMARGRFVRIQILSCSDGKGYASIHDMSLTALGFDSDLYQIDHRNRYLFVPETAGLTEKELLSHLQVYGFCDCTLENAADGVAEGSQVVITDLYGRQLRYTVTTEEHASLFPTELSLFRPVSCSSEQLFSSDGADTRAVNVNDGLSFTAWVASLARTSKRGAQYPEWVCIDLGEKADLTGVELSFETKGERVYQFEVLVSDEAPGQSDELPRSYRQIIDQKQNRDFQDGRYAFSVEDVQARYVLVNVIGNSIFPQKNQYAAAGLYELRIFGTPCRPA